MSSFFKKLFGGGMPATPAETAVNLPSPVMGQQHSVKTSRRKTPRQKTSQTGVVWVTLFDQTRVNVADLSYGGMLLSCEREKMQPYLTSENILECTLHIYHLSVPCQAHVVHGRNNSTGCSFIHSRPELLLFMRQILEFIRMGSQTLPIPKEQLNKAQEGLSSFQGDRGTSIQLKVSGAANVEMIEIQFRDGAIENRVQFNKGEIIYQRYRAGYGEDGYLALQQGFFLLLGFIEKYPHSGLEEIAQLFRAEIDRHLNSTDHRQLTLTA